MTNTVDHDGYIAVETAADMLKMTARNVHRYGVDGKLRTRKAGRRILYFREDVESLAAELAVDVRPPPKAPPADLVPAGEMLDYLRERDRKVDELEQKLFSAAAEIGRLQGIVEQHRVLTDEASSLQRRVIELEQTLEQAQKPWWKKWFRT